MLTRIVSGVRHLHDWTQFQSGSIYNTSGYCSANRDEYLWTTTVQLAECDFYQRLLCGGFYLQNPRLEAVGQPIVRQTSRLVIPRLCDIITNIWIMETGVFWLTQANARRPTGWRRNSIPRYLNTSQLRMMYEGCVSYVYFRHFLRARIWMSSPVSRSFFSIYSGATPRASCEIAGMICIFGKKNRARFCKSDGRYHTCGIVINRSSFQSFARHDRITVSKLISSGMNVTFSRYAYSVFTNTRSLSFAPCIVIKLILSSLYSYYILPC